MESVHRASQLRRSGSSTGGGFFAGSLSDAVRLAVFAMAAAFKFAGMAETAGYIAAAGFPFPLFLAWCAAALEVLLVIAFLTGAFFTPAALVAAAYMIFLGFSFHGPGRWAGNQAEFGFFVDHFTFLAGLFFAAVHGPGGVLSLNRGWPGRA